MQSVVLYKLWRPVKSPVTTFWAFVLFSIPEYIDKFLFNFCYKEKGENIYLSEGNWKDIILYKLKTCFKMNTNKEGRKRKYNLFLLKIVHLFILNLSSFSEKDTESVWENLYLLNFVFISMSHTLFIMSQKKIFTTLSRCFGSFPFL